MIGVNSAIATMSGSSGEQSGSIGLGFAIPSNQASRVVEQLIETGEAPHAVIGAILDLRYPEQGALIMEAGRGAETVMRGGPADQAGLRPGDVIVEFDGTTVRDATQLITLIHTKAPATGWRSATCGTGENTPRPWCWGRPTTRPYTHRGPGPPG